MSQRKRLPDDLRTHLGLPTGTIRVPQQVDTKIRTQHTPDVEHYESLNELWPRWGHAFADPTSVDTWQVYVPLDGTHWLAVIVGKDRTDSYNLISVFRIRDRNVRNSVKRALGN